MMSAVSSFTKERCPVVQCCVKLNLRLKSDTGEEIVEGNSSFLPWETFFQNKIMKEIFLKVHVKV